MTHEETVPAVLPPPRTPAPEPASGGRAWVVLALVLALLVVLLLER